MSEALGLIFLLKLQEKVLDFSEKLLGFFPENRRFSKKGLHYLCRPLEGPMRPP